MGNRWHVFTCRDGESAINKLASALARNRGNKEVRPRNGPPPSHFEDRAHLVVVEEGLVDVLPLLETVDDLVIGAGKERRSNR